MGFNRYYCIIPEVTFKTPTYVCTIHLHRPPPAPAAAARARNAPIPFPPIRYFVILKLVVCVANHHPAPSIISSLCSGLYLEVGLNPAQEKHAQPENCGAPTRKKDTRRAPLSTYTKGSKPAPAPPRRRRRRRRRHTHAQIVPTLSRPCA